MWRCSSLARWPHFFVFCRDFCELRCNFSNAAMMGLRLAFLQRSCRCMLKYSWNWLVPFLALFMYLIALTDTALPACPPIHIRMASQDEDWLCGPRGCDPGFFCKDGSCTRCRPCSDPYTLAAMGETTMYIVAACIDSGSCPNTCSSSLLGISPANATLCDCVGVTPPPPEPTPVVCREGCRHGGCETAGECICDDGWTGDLCDQCVLDCVNGHCNMSSGECICQTGWDGAVCDQDVSYCGTNQPCSNGGTCLNAGDGDYTCECPRDFTGTNCETVTELYLCEKTCRNGSCVEADTDTYHCKCQKGFTGVNCEKTESEHTGAPFWVFILWAAVVIFVSALVIIGCCLSRCKRLHLWKQFPWPLNNDSGIRLISKPLAFEVDGNAAILKELHRWANGNFVIRTCECVPKFPVPITDHMSEYRVPDLRSGFTYNFEIVRQTSSDDAEDSGCSVADCDVHIPATTNEDDVCTGTLEDVMNNIPIRKNINSILATSSELRRCISDFFHLQGNQEKVFVNTGDGKYVDHLADILLALDKLSCKIESLLCHVAMRPPSGSEDLVQQLTEFHPTCKVCPRICHHIHGGTTEWKAQMCNEVFINEMSLHTNSTQI